LGRLGFFSFFFRIYFLSVSLAHVSSIVFPPVLTLTSPAPLPPSAVAIAYIVLCTSHTISWYTHRTHTRGIYTAHQPNLWVILYAAVYLHYTIPAYTYGCTRIITTVSRIRSDIGAWNAHYYYSILKCHTRRSRAPAAAATAVVGVRTDAAREHNAPIHRTSYQYPGRKKNSFSTKQNKKPPIVLSIGLNARRRTSGAGCTWPEVRSGRDASDETKQTSRRLTARNPRRVHVSCRRNGRDSWWQNELTYHDNYRGSLRSGTDANINHIAIKCINTKCVIVRVHENTYIAWERATSVPDKTVLLHFDTKTITYRTTISILSDHQTVD